MVLTRSPPLSKSFPPFLQTGDRSLDTFAFDSLKSLTEDRLAATAQRTSVHCCARERRRANESFLPGDVAANCVFVVLLLLIRLVASGFCRAWETLKIKQHLHEDYETEREACEMTKGRRVRCRSPKEQGHNKQLHMVSMKQG